MSGGSYDYACEHIESLAQAIRTNADRGQTPALRLAFADLLGKCADAAKAIDFVDDGDLGPGDEDEKIRAVVSPQMELEAAIARAEVAMQQVRDAVAAAKARES